MHRRTSSTARLVVVLAGILIVGTAIVPRPVHAAGACAAGWTAVGGFCELEVTVDGSVNLPTLPAGDRFDILVVGGGGGGGGAGGDGGDPGNARGRAGGGGGGEVTLCAEQALAGAVTVTIGNGGTGSPGAATPSDGGDGGRTVVSQAGSDICDADGGKGGRAAGSNLASATDPYGDGGASGSAFAGGQSQWTGCTNPCVSYTSAGGGGGGAAAAGTNAAGGSGGSGGAGAAGGGRFASDARLFGGGGGGGSGRADQPAPAGGVGGGGDGARALTTATFDEAQAGTPGTGGGGGGGTAGTGYRSDGKAGGSGVVLIRYTAPPTVGAAGGPSLVVSSPVVECGSQVLTVGATVTCSVTGGDPNIDILWRASHDPVFAEAGVTLDESGVGEFTFVVPAAALGQELTVELVEWLSPLPLGVVGGPVPTSVPSGEGPTLPGWLAMVGLVALVGTAVATQRRQVVGG